MKKIILAVIIVALLFVNVCSVSAEGSNLSEAEAQKIFYDAYLVFHVYKNSGFRDWSSDSRDRFVSKVYPEDLTPEDTLYYIVDGVEYSKGYISELRLSDTKYDGLTVEKLKDIARLYYPESEIEDLMIDVNAEDGLNDSSLFYEKDGKVYPIANSHFSVRNPYLIAEYSDFTVSGNTASMTVLFNRAYRLHASCYVRAKIEFVNENGRWKLATNPFSEDALYSKDWLEDVEYWIDAEDNKMYYGNPEAPPNTGDETAILIALLALSGLALAFVPKVKKRKI